MTDTVNNSTSYLWYDYETFGTEARKDRPVQYGSFRTDTNFNIIGQSMVLYAQLADDYIPSPGSSLVTGITPMSLMDEENALAEADFAKVIRDEMGKPGTITIGYNNRNYDDEMTRFMFWRNLLPAYDTEYGEGRGRFDVFLSDCRLCCGTSNFELAHKRRRHRLFQIGSPDSGKQSASSPCARCKLGCLCHLAACQTDCKQESPSLGVRTLDQQVRQDCRASERKATASICRSLQSSSPQRLKTGDAAV